MSCSLNPSRRLAFQLPIANSMKHVCLLLSLLSFSARAQNLYFPPINNNLAWDTVSPQSLGWCTDKIDSLYDFLESENSKAFIVLKDGKIVLEKYFGTFTADSIWYWASAGKTLTSFLVGKASEDGILSLNDSTSRFLGTGWTAEPPQKERLITIRHQITMTTGLDDAVPDNHCTLDTCLRYKADAGTRWAYHNAPYTLLEKVLENASGTDINLYTQQKLKNQTGITGIWLQPGYDNVFYSKPRSMARFGLLVQNHFRWNTTSLLSDTAYIQQSTSTSQPLNLSYGYLWWLNGKSSFRLPGSQVNFPGSIAPDAPADMFAALGKNGQIISIAPSKGIVMVRMGNSGSNSEVSFLLCNQIWQRLNAVLCATTATRPLEATTPFSVLPNPVKDEIHMQGDPFSDITIYDSWGRAVYGSTITQNPGTIIIKSIHWKPGIYTVRRMCAGKIEVQKLWKE